MRKIVYSVLASTLVSAAAAPLTPPPLGNPPPGTSPGGAGGTVSKDKPQGFISKKTGKALSTSGIEDITNENFPDMIESFDYPNAEISDVVKAISELTGKNFIVDPAVHGKITIIAPSRITVAEAYKAFLSALAINNLAVVPGDGFYKIKQARQAQRDNIDTFSGPYYPTSDQMITRIIKLKYISADEVNKQMRILTSTNGEMVVYTPTNSLIISDYGSNMDRITKIMEQLDVPGFEEQMEVIRVRYARAKEIADLVQQIINKGEKSSQFGGVPRFRPAGTPESGGSGAEIYNVVVPDERTNSIVVVGNKAGIEKIRKLVSRLDYRPDSSEQGSFHVYYLRHAEAEPIANMLNGIATESKKALDQAGQAANRPAVPSGPGGQVQVGPASTAIFGGEIKVTPDKNTNSLVIVANKQDYELVETLIAKLDIAKDQVYIKTLIVEMSTDYADDWGISYYKFQGGTNGVGRAGFRGNTSLSNITDPTNDNGGVLGFGGGGLVTIMVGGTQVQVPSLAGLLNFLKQTTDINILNTPEIMALNNEESVIEVGDEVPVSLSSAQTTGGVVVPQIERKKLTKKLTITPYISPDTDSVKLKINQEIGGISQVSVASATDLAKASIATTTRQVKTNVVVNSGDTAVLGGLITDTDTDNIVKIPVLGDIPVIGWLFKSEKKEKQKLNLMVFITPKIIRNAEDQSEVFEHKISERIDFIQHSMSGRDVHGRYFDDLPRRKKAAAAKPEPSGPPPEEPAVESF